MKKLYGLIYWKKGDKNVYPERCGDGEMRTFTKLEEADNFANTFEIQGKVEYRVISLDSVHE